MGLGFSKLLLCIAGDLFEVRELSVSFLKQPGHVPVVMGRGGWPKRSSLYMEGSVPGASSLQAHKVHMVISLCFLLTWRGS